MPTARTRPPVTLTAFGALMDPDYLRQATSDPCAARTVEPAGRNPFEPLAALASWWARSAAELQRVRKKTIRSTKF